MASLDEFAKASFENQMENMYTSIPCIVVSVDNKLEGQIVSIKPTINQKTQDGTISERPTILGVPVIFPTSSRSGMTFPIKKGDLGLAIFSMRSIENWKEGNGYPSLPANFAKLDKSDAIFVPGLVPPSSAVNNPQKHIWQHSTEDVVVFHNLGEATETEIRFPQAGGIIINTHQNVDINCDTANVLANTSATLNTPLLTVQASQTNWVGNVTHTGTFTFNGIPFATHKHTGVTAGNAVTGTPTP